VLHGLFPFGAVERAAGLVEPDAGDSDSRIRRLAGRPKGLEAMKTVIQSAI